MKKILLTGSSGFIGTNFCKYVMPKYQDKYTFVSMDRLDDSHNLDLIPTNHKFYLADFTDPHIVDRIFSIERPDYFLHIGAKSFVDSSIEDPAKFSHSNVYGTQVLVEASVKYGVEKFHYCSTDEVYGQLLTEEDKSWDESVSPCPRNNYSSSKLGGELLLYSANQVKGLNYSISRCCNNIGFFQPDRNLIPKICLGLLKNRTIFLHDQGSPIREYINPIDHGEAMMKIMLEGENNQIYNVGTGDEYSNLKMVKMIAKYYDKKPLLDFSIHRPGQDFRYSVNSNKLRSLGWKPSQNFQELLTSTCDWYRDNLELYL